MSDRVLIGTRKGLFDVRRQRQGWQIAQTAFLGDPISVPLADSRDRTLYAAPALGRSPRSSPDVESMKMSFAPVQSRGWGSNDRMQVIADVRLTAMMRSVSASSTSVKCRNCETRCAPRFLRYR
jgi:hypothetical protein